MEQNSFVSRTSRFLTHWNILLIICGIAVNLLLTKVVNMFQLPLYLDTLGTIMAGALGGIIPGMAVGFFSNAINSFSDPTYLYYGILSVAIGALSTVFSEKGYFKSIHGCLIVVFSFIAITGIAGDSITWIIYGDSIGGTSAPIGMILNRLGVVPYLSQLIADLMIELPDKFLMIALVYLILKYGPEKLISKFPLGYLYSSTHMESLGNSTVKKSISKRMTYIIMTSIFISCIFSITVCLLFYMKRIRISCEDFALVVSRQAAGYVDGDQIPIFLEEGEANPEFLLTEENLKVLYDNSSKIKYLFVYAVYKDGVHVVFDLDTPDLEGMAPGTLLTPEQGLSSNYQEYIDGREIPIEYSKGEYGNILTVYTRIFDSHGNVAGYAGVDIDMDIYYNEFSVFAIQVVSIIFAMTMMIFTFVLWYIHKNIAVPIQMIVHQSEQLKDISPELWLDSEEWKNQIKFSFEDELSQLNDTVHQVEEKASLSMKRVLETEQKLLETKEVAAVNEKLEIAVRKAEDANKAKTDFLSRMSHDMRTPLNGILNFSQFILESGTLDEAKSYGSKILDSGHYLQTLINDTLGMSRIESGKIALKPEPYRYSEFEDSIRNVLDEKAKNKGVELRFVHQSELDRYILVDSLRLQQVCINILNNAIKFTPKGGVVLFRTERKEDRGTEELLQIDISDSGIGMSRKFMEEELYKPFAQERIGKDNEETGTGLGLSIAKQLVEIMGGVLSCQSEVGEGTTFTILLTVPTIEQIHEEIKQSVDLSKLNGAHILLCEDHYLNRQIASKLLEKVGCILDIAENGQIGVDKFKEHPDTYDLILMDIRMPVMDGLEAAKCLRNLDCSNAKTIPIVAMTANAYEEDIEKTKAAGMNAHLAKPVDPKMLYETLASLL